MRWSKRTDTVVGVTITVAAFAYLAYVGALGKLLAAGPWVAALIGVLAVAALRPVTMRAVRRRKARGAAREAGRAQADEMSPLAAPRRRRR